MTANIEILDENIHQDLNVDFEAARKPSFKQRLIPVVISEFFSLMFHYPIVFVKDGETGKFTCSLLLGVSDDSTLLSWKDECNDEALPLNVRRLPLVAIESSPNADPTIGINLDAPGVGKGGNLFKQESSELELAASALSELYHGHKETHDFVATALELDLISKLQAEIQFKGQPKLTLEGIYSIDTNRVSQLIDSVSKDKFLSISKFAYAQSFSLYNMKKLTFLDH